jgi:hypothetical protein
MKKTPILFLQAVITLIGIGVFVWILWEPHLEGRNAHATLFEIYFKDPFLACAYIASIPFFVALYNAFKILGYAGRNNFGQNKPGQNKPGQSKLKQHQIFSREAVKALRTIKQCAIAIIGFAVVGEIFIMLHTSDDRAGGVFMGVLIIVGSTIVAAAATVFEQIVQNALQNTADKFQEPISVIR